MAASVAIRDDDVPEADRALTRTLAMTPDARFLQNDAFRYAAMDAGRDALLRAEALAPSQHDDELASIVLGDRAAMRGDFARAQAVFGGDGAHGAKGPILGLIAPILIAWCREAQGDTGGALAILTPLASGRPFAPIYALHAALIAAAHANDPAEIARASALFVRTQAQGHGTDLLLTRAYAAWLAAHGQPSQAHALLQAALQARPNFTPVRDWVLRVSPESLHVTPKQGMALAYEELATGLQASVGDQGKLTRNGRQVAIVLARQGLMLAPDLTLLRLPFAGILASQGMVGDAIGILSAVAPDDALMPVVLIEKAGLEDRAGRTRDAIADLRRGMRADPDNPDLHAALGDLAQRTGQTDLAADEYDRALAGIPLMAQRRWSLLLARAACRDAQGRWPQARTDLEQAVGLAPDEPVLLNYLGYGEVEHGHDLPRAAAMLKHAASLAPDDPAIRDSYGWALLRTGHIAPALALLQSAAERTPRDPEVNYHLGMAYWLLGREVEAHDQWNQAAADKPQPADRREIEAALAMKPGQSPKLPSSP